MDEYVCLIIHFVELVNNVIKVFVVYVHDKLSNGSFVHDSISFFFFWHHGAKLQCCRIVTMV